jgi:hypothetical protein
VYFNPDMFVEQRKRAGGAGRAPRGGGEVRGARTEEVLRGRVDRILRDYGVVSLFDVEVNGTEVLEAKLTLNESAWAARRKFDGFSVLIAAPNLARTPAECVEEYRKRDQIERDFRTIKSVVELRPVHHRTDAKVRAHVTLCVLAMLLHRLLEHHLANASLEISGVAAIAQLALCHLNHVGTSTSTGTTHTVTKVQDDVRALLRSLELEQLVEDEHVRTRIVHR